MTDLEGNLRRSKLRFRDLKDWGSGSVCIAQGKHETLNSDPQLHCKSTRWCTSVLLALGAGWGWEKRPILPWSLLVKPNLAPS